MFKKDVFYNLKNINQKGGNDLAKGFLVIFILAISGYAIWYIINKKQNNDDDNCNNDCTSCDDNNSCLNSNNNCIWNGNSCNVNTNSNKIHIKPESVNKNVTFDTNKLILGDNDNNSIWLMNNVDDNKVTLQNSSNKLYLNSDLTLNKNESTWNVIKDKSNFYTIANSNNKYLSLDSTKTKITLIDNCDNNNLCKWILPKN